MDNEISTTENLSISVLTTSPEKPFVVSPVKPFGKNQDVSEDEVLVIDDISVPTASPYKTNENDLENLEKLIYNYILDSYIPEKSLENLNGKIPVALACSTKSQPL